VPMSGSAISAFRHHMIERWHGHVFGFDQRISTIVGSPLPDSHTQQI
jgi:hypothetical protein